MNPFRRMSILGLMVGLVLVTVTTAGMAQRNAAPEAGARVLTYTFAPTVTATGTVLHITLKFQGGPEGAEQIDLPGRWAGQNLHGVNNVSALSKDTTLADGDSDSSKNIHYLPNQTVVLTYDLVKDWTGPLVHPMQFHAVVMPEYFEFNGNTSLLAPRMDPETTVKVNFDWQKLPKDWSLATSFATSAGPDDRLQSYSGKWNQVREALFTAGDFRIHHFQIGQKPAVLAIRGEWTFKDDEAIAEIQKVIKLVRDFWHDDNFPYFLVTLNSYDQDHGSSEGSGMTNAFWLYLSRKDPISLKLPLIAHESFHSWNIRRMGVLTEGDSKISWFREGFTEYYGQLLVYRAGLTSLPAYLESINADLLRFPGSNSSYIRGRIIALWLDEQIRKNSNNKKSLDNMMYDIVAEANKPLTLDRVMETAGRYLSADDRRQLQQAVGQNGSLPAPDAAALGACSLFKVSLDNVPTFDLGFDYAASKPKRIVTGAKQDGPAFKAGLRDGQSIVSMWFNSDQPDEMAKIIVETDQGRQTIQYYPRGKTVTAPQYHLDQAAYTAHPEACKR